jgi:hypothetical protein
MATVTGRDNYDWTTEMETPKLPGPQLKLKMERAGWQLDGMLPGGMYIFKRPKGHPASKSSTAKAGRTKKRGKV